MRRRPLVLLVSVISLLSLGCRAQTATPVEPERVVVDIPSKPAAPELAVEPIVATVAFLADDAQLGRAPGTDADARVQAWIAERMGNAGLAPYLADGFLQRFEVGDGVRLRDGGHSRLAASTDESIAHAILPFGHDTGDATIAPSSRSR